MHNAPLLIHGYRLKRTSYACPEQYDVFADGVHVAYCRLRHGFFRVDVPDCGGTTIYTSEPTGDGVFTDAERVTELTNAILAIQDYYINRKYETGELA